MDTNIRALSNRNDDHVYIVLVIDRHGRHLLLLFLITNPPPDLIIEEVSFDMVPFDDDILSLELPDSFREYAAVGGDKKIEG